jgi:hypothetical protein
MSALESVVAALPPGLAELAAAEPGTGDLERVVGHGDRAFVMEAVHEGYLLHYGEPRLFGGIDGDLRLLAGDALFALGLARLAERADLPAVTELSDLISESARAHAEGRGTDVPALWRASAERLAEGA